MSMPRDFYEVLGVKKDADPDSIKKAYRKLAMQFHPDKNPGDHAAEEKFKEAASAYEVLSDPEKRSKYDRFGHSAFQGGRGGPQFTDVEDIFSSFGDIFEDFFGMSSGRQKGGSKTGPRKGADLRYVAEISMKDVILGVEKEIEFDTDQACETCHGSGAAAGSSPTQCQTCGGRGQVVRSQGFFSMASTCPQCAGEGVIIKDPCKPCKGKGRTRLHRKINLTIPAGVDTGTRLRVGSEGEGGYRGGPAGDLYVEIHVKEDPRFQRQGEHLVSERSISYLQLILGGEIDIETVTGKAKLEIPRGTAVGSTLKIPNEGVPSLRSQSGRRGDLYVLVQAEFPSNLNQEEETLLRQIAEKKGINVAAPAKGWFGRKKP